jgi:hypothetical protein
MIRVAIMKTCWLVLLILPCSLGAQRKGSPEASRSPDRVVDEYCRLDLNGARVGGGLAVHRIFKLVTWEVEPGWDTITVVRSYRLIDSRKTKTGAEVRVEYQVLGEIPANTLELKAGSEIITFVLRRSGTAWKIEKPVFQPHLSIEAAIAAERQALTANHDPELKRQIESNIKQLEPLKNTKK